MAFSLNKDNGEISMNGRVPAGEYNVEVNVYDVLLELNAKSTVKIVIKDIEEEAVLNSGSLRFQGTVITLLKICFTYLFLLLARYVPNVA